jgi:3-deoxy-manno-octulosonate cytidylyltransferase (CMP-KDO synthetase)
MNAQGPSAIAIIPARLGSTRFPGKVLASDTGKPLIQHVCEAAARASRVSRVVVAADDERIVQAVESFGGVAVMTDTDHPNGTSRLAQAARLLNLDADQILVNVQGDEPEIEPSVIDAAIEALHTRNTPIATCAAQAAPDDARNPNVVKVVVGADGCALYFSRSPIPHARDGGDATTLRHVGIYAYRRSFLEDYVSLTPTPLEITEKLEQLRVLEHGHRIAVAICADVNTHAGIDTPEQYRAFVERWIASHTA